MPRQTPPPTSLWKPISGDLTSGCLGAAPNGGRGCYISAIGIGGGRAIYTGSEEGHVYVSPDAQTSDNPTWTKVGNSLPGRPVGSIAVDRSNYRIAYVAFEGFNAGTSGQPGHVFKTTDGGNKWQNISGNLPDSPVNSLVLDPSYPNTLYAGTDVGAFVTYDGGQTWSQLGTGFPTVSIWQLDFDPSQAGVRTLGAGTHGRSAWTLDDARSVPAFDLSKVDAGTPVGPSSTMTYTLTLKNIGNGAATGVTITDPVPANTTSPVAQDGGTVANGKVTWSGLTVPAQGSVAVHFTVSVASALDKKIKSIVNDGVVVTSDQGVGTTGSPFVTPLAPPYAVKLAPATQTNGGKGPTDVDYHVTVSNLGFNNDTYAMSSSGSAAGFTVSFLDSSCTTPLASNTTPTVTSGSSTDVCVRVNIASGASGNSVATVKATSSTDATVSATANVKTIGVGPNDALLVDNDDNNPDVQQYYKDALTAANVPFQTWDLKADGSTLPQAFLMDFTKVVWFTGNSYPDPVRRTRTQLTGFLDAGAGLFMSGQDILDQAAGTSSFFWTTCTSTGTAPRRRTTSRQRTFTAWPAPDHRRHRRRPDRPQRPQCSVRGPDHSDRHRRSTSSPTTAVRRRTVLQRRRTRSSSSPSRWRRTETQPLRPTLCRGC